MTCLIDKHPIAPPAIVVKGYGSVKYSYGVAFDRCKYMQRENICCECKVYSYPELSQGL